MLDASLMPTGLILHSDAEQTYFIDIIYIYTYKYIHKHTYLVNLVEV